MGGIADGRVQVEGIEPIYVSIKSGPEIFARMIKNKEFDVSEMSASTYMSARTRGDFPFVAIPVFPSKSFRHSFIFINKKSGIRVPSDLMGRRVGMMGYGQTAAVWIRGMLEEDFGIDLRKVSWLEGGSDAPYVAGKNITLPAGINIEVIPDTVAMSDLLSRGEIDAMFGARHPASFGKTPDVIRLFPNYREIEQDYFRRTGIFPIMHTIVIREELYERHRWIAASLYKAFEEAKRLADRDMRFSGAMRYALPWLAHDIDEIDDLFNGDPFCYGVGANRASLSALARYLRNQGFIDRPIDVDAIFAPVFTDRT
ncbi:MAG TPA: PhnD/SsuA/transferrin family substrate-binding protein [Steroidobacteraceae bacterium]